MMIAQVIFLKSCSSLILWRGRRCKEAFLKSKAKEQTTPENLNKMAE